MSFSHLHVHSHYSLLKASCTIPNLIDKCLSYGMPALALTDYGNMFGAMEFYFQALEKGINPIIGCEVYYVKDRFQKTKNSNENFRTSTGGANTLVLLAKNNKGYENLCRISTIGYQEGFYFVPRVDYRVLESHKEGLIALTGGQKGSLLSIYRTKGKEGAKEEINRLKSIFSSQFYLSFAPKGIKGAKMYNRFLAHTAIDKKIDLIATNDVHYLEKEESVIEDVLSCIGTNRTLNDSERAKLGPSEFYFKTNKEMSENFGEDSGFSSEYKKACEKTLEIASSCSVRFKLKKSEGDPIYHLPKLSESNPAESLKKLSLKGLKKRFKEAELRGEKITLDEEKTYRERLEKELQTISRMGFDGYFYIVQDFIHWARSEDIPVGPGRGSGASSLVSYSLRITDLDPMPLHLIFERFLNPERISMPDFDIDFCQENRWRVIDYITKKYGKECTSHVITYGHLSVRAALRDVGRVLGLTFQETDQIVKLIPDRLGITLKEALKLEPRLKSLMEEDPQIKQLIQLAGMVEGLIRHVSLHAAGIIIADNPIIEYAPLYKGAENENVIQYDLKHAEKIGLVKFDFLGLKTLTQIKETFRLIEKTQNKKIRAEQISIKDPGIYEIMCQGDTVGVFQFEGQGITDLLIRAQPTCFEDIVAINALYRPGPMNMIPDWLERKKGGAVNYIFPELEPILNETYGIIVYQEQVQQIAVKIAGYSYGEADILRRAMGKKIQSVMDKQKERFLKGARDANYDLKKSEKLFDLMAEFAKYGFNKSHAAAYCVLAAQTAYLKRYYPIEFFASQMTIDQGDSEKIHKYVKDAGKHNISCIPPHINTSDYNFSVHKGKIHFSLGALKGVGEAAAKEIMETRNHIKDKKFYHLEDFFENVDLRKVNKKALESLIKAGAFDGLGLDRKEVYENYPRFLQHAQQTREDKEAGQQSLFSAVSGLAAENHIKLKRKTSWPHKEKLKLEKEIIGFYLSAHPMEPFKGLEKQLGALPIENLEKLTPPSSLQKKPGYSNGKPSFRQNNFPTAKALGIVSHLKESMTKKSSKIMAFSQLEDSSGSIEVIFFPNVYKEFAPVLLSHKESIVSIKGSVRKEQEGSGRLIVEEVKPIDEVLKKLKLLKLSLPRNTTEDILNRLKILFKKRESGNTVFTVGALLKGGKTFVEIKSKNIPDKITVDQDFLQEIYKVLKSTENIRLVLK